MTLELKMLRLPKVKEKTGRDANSTIYQDVENELITKPVNIGPRASGWPEHEIDVIVAARISGKSDDEVRQLVKELMGKRKSLLTDILAA